MRLHLADTKLELMRRPLASGMIVGLFLLCSAANVWGQAFHAPVVLTVVDENGLPVSEAHVTVSEQGRSPLQLLPIMRAAALTRCIGTLRIRFAYRSLASMSPSNLRPRRILPV
jgi:hypothetical protein